MWHNRIRGKLGKTHSGFLTMEDLDRRKVFVEKCEPPDEHITEEAETLGGDVFTGSDSPDTPKLEVEKQDNISTEPSLNVKENVSENVKVDTTPIQSVDTDKGIEQEEPKLNLHQSDDEDEEAMFFREEIEDEILEIEIPDVPHKKKNGDRGPKIEPTRKDTMAIAMTGITAMTDIGVRTLSSR
eukprot:TRINITY_DN2440_c0_g1_i1.p1 TRINITY_DN2440_c0_g1~~TRINITY_DN2440_c0_g1_i1.p1  ORF type:complete len:184 (-),score=40.91 TRINITY_DN2440_c0_g1_i1:137-688(-)